MLHGGQDCEPGRHLQSGDDKNTIKLEQWKDESTDTFSIDGNKLTMNENSGLGLCGTYDKQ